LLIIPFKAHHLDKIKVQDTQINELNASYPYAYYLESTQSYTAVSESEIIMCGGVLPTVEGCCDLWMLFSDKKPQGKLSVYRYLKEQLNKLQTDGYHRIQTLVDINNKKAVRFIESMGFQNEGVMRKCYRKKDYFRYAFISEEI
jgi:hypothetical protein